MRVVLSIGVSGFVLFVLNKLVFVSFANWFFPCWLFKGMLEQDRSNQRQVFAWLLSIVRVLRRLVMAQICLNIRCSHCAHQSAVVHLELHFRSDAERLIFRANDKMIACCADKFVSKWQSKARRVRVLIPDGKKYPRHF